MDELTQVVESCRRRIKKLRLAPVKIPLSIVRRRVLGLQRTVVGYDFQSSRIIADLRTSIGLQLYRYGYWDASLQLVSEILQPGDKFVDGGANIGLFSLVAARRVGPTGKVFAFEPSPATAHILSENCVLNGYSQVEINQVALSEVAGKRDFYAFSGSRAGLSSFLPIENNGAKKITVASTTLDEALSGGHDKLRLVKLDLEGAEVKALRGATTLLQKGVIFFVEVEPLRLRHLETSERTLYEIFSNNGYIWLQRSSWVPNVLFVKPDAASRLIGSGILGASAALVEQR